MVRRLRHPPERPSPPLSERIAALERANAKLAHTLEGLYAQLGVLCGNGTRTRMRRTRMAALKSRAEKKAMARVVENNNDKVFEAVVALGREMRANLKEIGVLMASQK